MLFIKFKKIINLKFIIKNISFKGFFVKIKTFEARLLRLRDIRSLLNSDFKLINISILLLIQPISTVV